MKHLIMTTAALVLVGCSTNVITVANSGHNVWQKVEVWTGGRRFAIGKLEAGESRVIRFRSKQENVVLINGEINGEKLAYEFNHYTANLPSAHAIFINNSHLNEIEIVDLNSTVQTLDELLNEKRRGDKNPASINLKTLSDVFKAEGK